MIEPATTAAVAVSTTAGEPSPLRAEAELAVAARLAEDAPGSVTDEQIACVASATVEALDEERLSAIVAALDGPSTAVLPAGIVSDLERDRIVDAVAGCLPWTQTILDSLQDLPDVPAAVVECAQAAAPSVETDRLVADIMLFGGDFVTVLNLVLPPDCLPQTGGFQADTPAGGLTAAQLMLDGVSPESAACVAEQVDALGGMPSGESDTEAAMAAEQAIVAMMLGCLTPEEMALLGDAAPATPTETTATTSESRAATTTEAPLVGESSLDSPIQLGAVVQVGSWRLRVSAITPDGTDEVMEENQFNDPPPEGNQFFIASLEATYTGTESSTFSGFSGDMRLKSVGDSRVAYEGFDASCGVIPDDIDDSGEAFPGGTVTGNVCWSIQSTDAASLVMIAEESFNFDDDTRAFLSLDPTATPINETTSLEEGRESGFESAVAIGESATVGGWELKVVAITPDGTDEVMEENQFNDPPPEGNQFFIASLEATYTGTESSTFSGFSGDIRLKSVGDSRVAYEGFDASCGVIPDDIDDSGEAFPGGTVTGNVCWSIQSTDAASLVMIVKESSNFDDDTRAFFALAN